MDTIAILIPVYNEAETLSQLMAELEKNCTLLSNKFPINFQIIFVDDGSIDNSVQLIKSFTQNSIPIKLITFSRNFGKEAAISAGLEAGKYYSAVLIMDADLQHPPAFIIDLINTFQKKNYDMVYAFKKNREKENFLSRIFSKAFYRLININNRYNIPKNAGDFRILSQEVVNAILKLPENEKFMKGLYAWVGYKQIGIPYLPSERKNGKSFYSIWNLLLLSIDGITSFSITPLRIMSMVGFFISILSVFYFLFIIFEYLFLNTSIPGLTSIFVLVSFFGGVQLVCLGIIGEYIGKILMEAKRRPTYIIRKNSNITKGAVK